jgi:hypothetical protein
MLFDVLVFLVFVLVFVGRVNSSVEFWLLMNAR